jgi:hypothetical protein
MFVIWSKHGKKRHQSFEIKALRGPTWSLAAVAIYSHSPKTHVGSTVSVYVINAITNVNQPIIPFIEIEWRLIHVLKFSYI